MVELVEEARAAVAYLEQSPFPASNHSIISLEPLARAFLRQRGLMCSDTLPFFTNGSHARVLHESEKLRRLVERDFQVDVGDGLSEIYRDAFASYARHRWELMLRTIDIMDGIRRAFPQCTWLACSQRDIHVGDSFRLPFSDEGFLGSLGVKFCQRFGISLETMPFPDAGQSPAVAESRRLAWSVSIFDWLITRCYLSALALQGRSTTVLAADPFLLGRLMSSIYARFPQVKPLALRDKSRRSRRQELRHALFWLLRTALGQEPVDRLRIIPLDMLQGLTGRREEAKVRQIFEDAVSCFMDQNGHHFQFRGVSFLSEFRTEVENSLLPSLLNLYRVARAENHLLQRVRPSLVLSCFNMERQHALARLCRVLDIPTMIIPVKVLSRPKNELEEIGELQIGRTQFSSEYSFAAVQTPLALGYMQHVGYTGQFVLTGPLIRSRVAAAERRQQRANFFQEMGAPGKVVVYAPSMKRKHALHVVQTPDEVLSSMADIVETVTGMEGMYLILRLHPNTVVKRDAVEALIDLPPGVTISHTDRHSFSSVLALADVLISNASTTTEEALLNGVPVILYDKWARYNHLDAPVVRTGVPDGLSPAYYVSSREHLGSTLEWVLNMHPPGTPLPPALLERYVFQEDLTQNFYDFVGRMVGRSR